MTKEQWYKQLFEYLGKSKFRSSFHLKQKDIDYINEVAAKNFLGKIEGHSTFFYGLCPECMNKADN